MEREQYAGSDCTGVDGTANRTLSLANSALIYNEFIIVDRQVLTPTTDYTVDNNVTASIITFLKAIWNTQTIMVYYEYNVLPMAVYTTPAMVYAKAGLSATEVDLTVLENFDIVIDDANNELEMLAGRKFTNANAITEYFSGRDKDIIDKYQTTINLNHFPIQSITEFKTLDSDGTATNTFGNLTTVQITAGTYSTTDYWLETSNDPLSNSVVPYGKISLKTVSIPKGVNNVKIAYTYGYGTVPLPIRNLATDLAAIRIWITFLGGQYNRLNSYSIPQQTVEKGDFYQRGKQMIDLLTEEANRLLDRIGRKPRTLFFSTGADR